MAQGFDYFDDNLPEDGPYRTGFRERKAAATTKAALHMYQLLADSQGPHFCGFTIKTPTDLIHRQKQVENTCLLTTEKRWRGNRLSR